MLLKKFAPCRQKKTVKEINAMYITVRSILENLPGKKRGLITIDQFAKAEHVAQAISESQISIIVITKNGIPCGLVSKTDINNMVADGKRPSECEAWEIMTKREDVITTTLDASTSSLSAIMRAKKFTHVIVVSKTQEETEPDKKKWTDVISLKDLDYAAELDKIELEDLLKKYGDSELHHTT